MALYEPSAFHLLRQMGEQGAEPYAEITGVARHICQGVVTGDYRGAVAAFVDYWNGPGSWNALRPSVQRALIRWAPKGPLDFRALIDDPTPAAAYGALAFPVLILRGEHAPSPTRVIAEGLAQWLPASRIVDIAGAGHMGPLTHTPEVSALIVRHIVEAEAAAQPSSWRRRGAGIAGATSHRAEAVS
jgi:pimeloyl-ACP methyl ester carboxylesterase